jgi:MinD-like ATPase involved in chromosome partitioning or flagellar assembly
MSCPDPLDRPHITEVMDVSVPTTAGDYSGVAASSRVASHPATVTERLGQMRASPPGQPVPLPNIPPPGIPVPDLRTRPPVPVVPWPLRAQHWLRDRTQPGRSEAEHDNRIADFMALMSTGCHILATIGPKGGPGKTTVALTTGLILAEVPLARPIVVELNPDWGTIDQLLGRANPKTIQDLLHNLTAVNQAGIGLLQGFVTMWGRLPVLTAPSRPDAMARLAPRDYERVLKLLSVHYNVIILDCGTAFTQRLNQFAIQAADHLQVVGWPDHPTLQKTVAAIDYLASSRYAHDYQGVLAELTADHAAVRARALADMTLVVNGAGFAAGAAPVDLAKVRAAVAGLNGVVPLPYSGPLRRMLGDGTLTIDALPADYRRAVKMLLVAVLGRLVEL